MSVRLFFSVGEPSGDLHASNLIRALSQSAPDLLFAGLGGPKMADAGCQILYPLADHPVMGISAALRSIPRLRRVLAQTRTWLGRHRPSAVVLVDYPGFNWHLARVARSLEIPVAYYVPPQIWAWASYRIKRMKQNVDHVLCTLPFEEAWYQSHGMDRVVYVGHPFFDDLDRHILDEAYCDSLEATRGRARLLLLPGSRPSEVRKNGKHLIRCAQEICRRSPGVSVDVAAFDEAGAQAMRIWAEAARLPIQTHVGKTRELMASADVAVSVSGSVSLELLYYRVPSVMVYSINPIYENFLMPWMLHAPHITLVNLMAGQRLFPEFLGRRDHSRAIADQVSRWLDSPIEAEKVRRKLGALCEEYADSGASSFAANYLLHDVLKSPTTSARAA